MQLKPVEGKKKGQKKILRVTNKLRMEGHTNGEENKERTV